MTYEDFCGIMNERLFSDEKTKLLKKLAQSPARFTGLFRATKPATKLVQHLTQSREIRFGDAMEEVVERLIREAGFRVLPKQMMAANGERLSLDQYFTDETQVFFVEQKVRDDHDSTKKRGQLSNFASKLDLLVTKHVGCLAGAMYFLDEGAQKNKNFYLSELDALTRKCGIPLHLFYGPELFEKFVKYPQGWGSLLEWLRAWRKTVSEMETIDFDAEPNRSFEEVRSLPPSVWRRIAANDSLWESGVMNAIFSTGDTLQAVADSLANTGERQLAATLTERMRHLGAP